MGGVFGVRTVGHPREQRLQLRAARSAARAAGEAVVLVVGQRRATLLAQLGALDTDGRRSLRVRARGGIRRGDRLV